MRLPAVVPAADPVGQPWGWAGAFGWDGFGHWAHLAGAFACALLAVWTLQRRSRTAAAGPAEICALWASALWSLFAAGAGPHAPATELAESLRNLTWLAVTYSWFVRDGRHETMRPVRPMLAVLACVELMQPVLQLLGWRFASELPAQLLIVQVQILLRMLVVTGALVLVHNLYVGAIGTQRPVRWVCAALALMWGYDLNYYTIAWLAGTFPPEMTAMRGAAEVFVVEMLAIGAVRGQENQRLSPSRAVAFQSLSVLLIGLYLVVMVAAARSMAWFGGASSNLVELVFVLATCAFCLAAVPSRRLRGWMRITVIKHFFQHRYDYRAEWQRFTETIGRAGPDAPPLNERVVKALADVTDSPCGLLFLPDDTGMLTLAARWQWRTAQVPAMPFGREAQPWLERGGFILDLDEGPGDGEGDAPAIPAWLAEEERAWALVPLIHFGRLAGLVLLGRPAYTRRLDWEDFDLLRLLGRQLASYLAEAAGQNALLEAGRFEEFNRRMAFVMHDIKNVASQVGLLARNAERHAENPAFRADMLVTLRNASDRLESLLARLSRYGAGPVEDLAALEVAPLLANIAAGYPGAPITVEAEPGLRVVGGQAALEQVLHHLVQNAIDASQPGEPLLLRATATGNEGGIEVIDHGTGMSAEFIHFGLFRPFVSTKPGGFGIGAFEARSLVQAMRGRLEVESLEGIGSRFLIRLPLAERMGTAAKPLEKKVA